MGKNVFLLIFLVNLVKYAENKNMEDHYQQFLSSEGNLVDLDDENFRIICMKNLSIYSFEKFNYTRSFKRVKIVWCMPPKNSSYSQFIQSLNIDANAVKKLHLMHNVPVEMNKSHFTNLEIEELLIENEGLPMNVQLSNDFLEPLDALKSLTVDNVAFPPLPNDINIPKIVLRNGVSTGGFGYCTNVIELHLVHWSLPITSENWLGNCSNLINLRLERMTLVGLNVALMGIKTIETLNLTRCDLIQIPHELLKEATNLKHLEITYNYLQNLRFDEIMWLASLTNLEVLDFSNNELITGLYVLIVTLTKPPKIQAINLAHNSELITCRGEKNPEDFHGYKTMLLPRLSLEATNMKELCFSPLTIENLEYLDLKDNKITLLKYKELPLSHTKYKVDLRGNPLQNVEFGQKDYEICATNGSAYTNATVLTDSLFDCDCQNGWFAKALREQCLSVESVICTDKIEINLKPPDELECNKVVENGCILREMWKDAEVIANCRSANINALPIGNRIKEVYAADNNIETIAIENLPSTLKFLDLRRNSISRVDENVARNLFNNSRHLLLQGNPILCSCHNKYFIEQLQAHHLQVDDYNNLTCAGEFLLIRDVIASDLCAILLLVPTVISGVLIFIALISYILYRMYWEDVKMFLFTHGWCLWCVHEEDLDADRKFDAFISFCHQEYEFVNEQLCENLEPGYQLCLHYRDWLVGEWIPAQIQMSIQLSKRTIIVLSKLYLDSVWGMFEFRMAYAMSMKEGRNRVIVIILDDVLDAEMPPDLRFFVSNNTYLKWGDPWFWQKLKFVLPHKREGDSDNDKDVHVEHPPKHDISRYQLAIKPAEKNLNENVIMVD